MLIFSVKLVTRNTSPQIADMFGISKASALCAFFVKYFETEEGKHYVSPTFAE